MNDGGCTPSGDSPVPEDERTARIALAVIVTNGVPTPGGVACFLS